MKPSPPILVRQGLQQITLEILSILVAWHKLYEPENGNSPFAAFLEKFFDTPEHKGFTKYSLKEKYVEKFFSTLLGKIPFGNISQQNVAVEIILITDETPAPVHTHPGSEVIITTLSQEMTDSNGAGRLQLLLEPGLQYQSQVTEKMWTTPAIGFRQHIFPGIPHAVRAIGGHVYFLSVQTPPIEGNGQERFVLLPEAE